MTERVYTWRIDMTYKGRDYRRGDKITSAAIGLPRNEQHLLSRNLIILVEDATAHDATGSEDSPRGATEPERRKPGRPRIK